MTTEKHDIQSEITNSIIAALEAGAGSFELPWQKKGLKSPINHISAQPYRGTNFLVLLLVAHANGYSESRWATFKQWRDQGAIVRKGERGTPIVFYKLIPDRNVEPAGDGSSADTIPLMRHSHVFNVSQLENPPEIALRASSPASQINPMEIADKVIARTRAIVRHIGQSAYYRPSTDEITMPSMDLWQGSSTSSATEAYYSTLLHELVHWTGSAKRLDRIKSCRFGDREYCQEELVAEVGAAFACVDLGITPSPRPDHAAYIAQYIDLLKSDKRAIFRAAAAASRAVEFIMNVDGVSEGAAAD